MAPLSALLSASLRDCSNNKMRHDNNTDHLLITYLSQALCEAFHLYCLISYQLVLLLLHPALVRGMLCGEHVYGFQFIKFVADRLGPPTTSFSWEKIRLHLYCFALQENFQKPPSEPGS